jgi:peptidoglycan/xylan/chitin deacetylase (PgdA/CDA1 family)
MPNYIYGNCIIIIKAIEAIIVKEQNDEHGLNGFILLIHVGTDPKRTDKLYNRLDELLNTLEGKGYTFTTLDDVLRR